MNLDINEMFKNLGGMKEQMENVQRRLAGMEISGEAGAGMVRITLGGDSSVKSVDIDESLFAEKDKGMLEELIISAFNDAQKKVREALAHELKGAAGTAIIPGMERFFNL